MRINNAPKYIRRRVNVVFWGAVTIGLGLWIVPMLYAAMDAKLGI